MSDYGRALPAKISWVCLSIMAKPFEGHFSPCRGLLRVLPRHLAELRSPPAQLVGLSTIRLKRVSFLRFTRLLRYKVLQHLRQPNQSGLACDVAPSSTRDS